MQNSRDGRTGTPAGLRDRRVRRLVLGALLVAAAVRPAATGAVPPAPVSQLPPAPPSRVAVHTGRGDFDLVVYRPAVPAPAGGGAQSTDPAPSAVAGAERPAVLLISGEGGWASFVDRVATMLAAEGWWVGGLDAKRYFADAQDDRAALATDVRAFADALVRAAGRPAGAPLLLAGFSFGADIAPRVATDSGWAGRVRGLLMIAPDAIGSLQYRWLEMIGIDYREHTFEVAAALREAGGIPVLLVHGENDGSSAAPDLATAAAEPKRLSVVPGAGHHFSGRDDNLREALRDGLGWLLKQPVRPRGGAGERP